MNTIISQFPHLKSSLQNASGGWVSYNSAIGVVNGSLDAYVEKSQKAAQAKAIETISTGWQDVEQSKERIRMLDQMVAKEETLRKILMKDGKPSKF